MKPGKQLTADHDFWAKKQAISFLCCLMVTIIHVSPSTFPNYPGEGGIYAANDIFALIVSDTVVRTAVPLFFILAGACMFRDYNNGAYLRKMKSRIHTLVIPYLIWNTLSMLFLVALTYSPFAKFTIGRELFVPTVKNILLGIIHFKYNEQFWFLFDLIIFSLLAPLFDLLIKSRTTAFISLGALLVLLGFGIQLPGAVFYDGTAVIYYLSGAVIGRFFFASFSEQGTRGKITVSGIAFFTAFICYSLYALQIIALPDVLRTILLIVFSLALWRFSDCLLSHVRVTEVMGFSFIVYALHPNVISCVTKLLYLLLPKNGYWAIPNWVITFCATMGAILLFAWFVKKKFGRVYSIISGNR